MTTIYTPESPDNKAIRELRDEVKKLRFSIEEFNKVSSAQTEKIIDLTGKMLILTIAMLVLIGFNLYVYIKYSKIQVAPIVNEQTRKNQQVLERCKYTDPNQEVDMTDGTKMKCSDFIKKFRE